MARRIANYQDLQDRVADYLNRADLASQIQDFIYLGERKIFRWYRNHNNEKRLYYDMRRNPNPSFPRQIAITDRIDLFGDYLETLMLSYYIWDGDLDEAPVGTVAGKPLERVSLDALEMARWRNSASAGAGSRPGEPAIFARDRNQIVVHPAPTTNGDIQAIRFIWQFYVDYSGEFTDGTSDNDVLRTAPDLYLYSALLEAEPFLKPEDDAFQRIPIWKAMYEEATAQIIEQDDAEKYSGSNVEIQSAFGPGARRSLAADTATTGWA